MHTYHIFNDNNTEVHCGPLASCINYFFGMTSSFDRLLIDLAKLGCAEFVMPNDKVFAIVRNIKSSTLGIVK